MIWKMERKYKDWNVGSWKSVPHLERGESRKNQMMRRYKNDKSGKIIHSTRNKTKIILSFWFLFDIRRAITFLLRLYCEVDVPLDKRSCRCISSHTHFYNTKKWLYIRSGGEHRSRYLSSFCHIWWKTQASIAVPLVFLSHLVENPRIDRGTFRFFLSHLVENPSIDPGTSRFFVTSGG